MNFKCFSKYMPLETPILPKVFVLEISGLMQDRPLLWAGSRIQSSQYLKEMIEKLSGKIKYRILTIWAISYKVPTINSWSASIPIQERNPFDITIPVFQCLLVPLFHYRSMQKRTTKLDLFGEVDKCLGSTRRNPELFLNHLQIQKMYVYVYRKNIFSHDHYLEEKYIVKRIIKEHNGHLTHLLL